MNDPGQDLELRLVRYFTVVAAHQHFGRAAAELHVAQPALSRQIQRLEKYLGVRLLDRTPQGTRLTPAGRTFLPRGQALLQAARQAELAVREQTQTERIAIGYVEDLVITAAVRELRRHHPDAEISVVGVLVALRRGQADAARYAHDGLAITRSPGGMPGTSRG